MSNPSLTSRTSNMASTEGACWMPMIDSELDEDIPIVQLSIDFENPAQSVDAFGACFSELGWIALSRLDRRDRESALRVLFDPDDGAALSYCRMPIGANDFAESWYSHNEVEDDYAMEHFSIERDRKHLLPFIREARRINPNLRVWASPWCPPSWMKVSRNYASSTINSNWGQILGSDTEDLDKASGIRDENRVLDAYALYFAKFIQAYAEEGIPIEAVHVQNETHAKQIFPSCIWEKEVFVRFIADHLEPVFRQSGLDTQIWAGTFNGDEREYAEWIANHPSLHDIVRGGGFQWHSKKYLREMKRPRDDFQVMQTESECHNGSNDWDTAFVTFDLLCHYFNSGANSYMYWNIALDQWGLSNWGWRQNSLITVDNMKRTFRLNPDYYAMRHFSSSVKTGDKYLPASSSDKDISVAAFRDAEGSCVAMLANKKTTPVKVPLRLNGLCANYVTLPSRAFATIEIKAPYN